MSLPLLSKWRFKLVLSALALTLCASFGSACSSSGAADSASSEAGMAGVGPGDAGASGDGELEPIRIAFTVTDAVIDLDPKEVRELAVRVDPPGSFMVHFALPASSADDDPEDAVLDRNQAQTDERGIARVVLTAPSMPANFSVRASVGVQQAELRASVGGTGYTTLQVVPSYSGKRSVALWTATATAARGASCSKLSGTPPPDGQLSVSGPPTGTLQIPHVPVGLDVVVTLRAGHYIGGCATLPPLSEIDGNTVLIYAQDRPLNFADTELQIAFGPSDSRPAFDKLLASGATLAESALIGDAESDVAALLDEMENATPKVDRSAFAAAREQGAWDLALETAFGQSAARRLRAPAQRWIEAGLSSFDSKSTFTGVLDAAGNDAIFKLSEVAGLSPSAAGFESKIPATWSADPSDTLLLGTKLTWSPSRLATALAGPPALLEHPSATSVEEALAQSVDCALVSSVLLAHGTSAGVASYPGCDSSCGSSTCELALSNLWDRAALASGANVASLAVTATGSAEVGDAAEVIELHGSWVGQLTDGASEAEVSGELDGQGVGG